MGDNNPALETSTELLCPKAENVPPPLMDEYLKMAHDRSGPINWHLRNKDTGNRDYYWANHRLFVGLVKDTDPRDPAIVASIMYIGNMLNDPQNRSDQYDHGVRTETDFETRDGADKTFHMVTFDSVNGKEHVASESGTIYPPGADTTQLTHYKAQFDASGKIVNFETGNSWGNLTLTHCRDK